jgi:hypothetical protein
MLYDAETRILIARERANLLRSQAVPAPGDQRARRWLAGRLIAAGVRLAPEHTTPRQPVRGAAA